MTQSNHFIYDTLNVCMNEAKIIQRVQFSCCPLTYTIRLTQRTHFILPDARKNDGSQIGVLLRQHQGNFLPGARGNFDQPCADPKSLHVYVG